MQQEAPFLQRRELVLYLMLAAAAGTYVVLRALFVPLVHDETTSFLAYAQPGTFLPFRSMWDANNHFLNSACGWLGYSIGGLHLFALRWASVAAFALYAWSAWRIGNRIGHRGVCWCLWCALLFCPLVIEYFSLFRGYGPALAFLLFALEAMTTYAVMHDGRSLWRALAALALANGFVLALVPLWTIALVLLAVLAKAQRRHLAVLWVVGFVPLALVVGYSFLMSRYGLLYHGSTEGFVAVTVRSLALGVFGTGDPVVVSAMLAAVVGGLGLVTRRAVQERSLLSPSAVVAWLLVLEGIGRIAAAHIIGLNHASDRTAMHLLLLGILVVAFAADNVRTPWQWRWCFALLLLPLPLRTLTMANLEAMVLCPEQSIPAHFINYVEALEQDLGRPAVVATHRLAGHPWALQRRMGGGEGDVNAHSWPQGLSDVLILPSVGLATVSTGYAVADSAPGNQLYLLVREPRLAAAVVSESTFRLEPVTGDRLARIQLPAHVLREHDLFVELSGTLTSPADPLDVQLIISVLDSAGQPVHGDLVFLNTRREDWNGEAWRTIRHVPRNPAAHKAFFFFRAPPAQPYALSNGRLVVRTARP